MLIYEDIISGDEMVSDSFPMKEIDGIVYEVDCKMIVRGTVQVDTGANASAEGGEEELDDGEEKVNDVLDAGRLSSTSFGKKDYLTYLKGYMKAVKASLSERGAPAEEITAFEKGAQKYVKDTILPNFKDFEFYTGQKMNPDGMVALLNYREDGITPYVIFWKHGLKEVKV